MLFIFIVCFILYRRRPAAGDQLFLHYGNAVIVIIVETIISYYFSPILCYTFTVITYSFWIWIGRKTMRNKRGGVGAKILLVLILMIASAVGGAYGYRVLDGKLAVRDAMKAVEDVDISDYDSEEQAVIQGYIDEAKKDLDTAKTRKEVYEVIGEFIADVAKVQTSNEKKLEEALRAAEEAKKQYGNNNNSNNNNYNNDQSTDQSYNTDNSNTTDNNSNLDSGITSPSEEDNEESGGFLNSLIGGMTSGSSGN